MQAAERRRLEDEARGIKNIDKVKRMQQRSEEIEKREKELQREGGGGATLKVCQKTIMIL